MSNQISQVEIEVSNLQRGMSIIMGEEAYEILFINNHHKDESLILLLCGKDQIEMIFGKNETVMVVADDYDF